MWVRAVKPGTKIEFPAGSILRPGRVLRREVVLRVGDGPLSVPPRFRAKLRRDLPHLLHVWEVDEKGAPSTPPRPPVRPASPPRPPPPRRRKRKNERSSHLPEARAYNPVAYLRQFATFPDAVRQWAVEKPDRQLLNLVQQCFRDAGLRERSLEKIKGRKKECATEILEALGLRQDFDAAAKAMDDWCVAARAEAGLTLRDGTLSPKFIPLMNTVWEITCTLRPLLESYRDPDRFFREIAPRRWPTNFLLSSKEDLALVWRLGTRSYQDGRPRDRRDSRKRMRPRVIDVEKTREQERAVSARARKLEWETGVRHGSWRESIRREVLASDPTLNKAEIEKRTRRLEKQFSRLPPGKK
jgi:hypothetical protein